ncbi:MAG: deoxyribose-phosphate aldolase [Planctomycetota bacterium]|nr:deoxyribose-phosphate aldolase [Planctomycetota bacterium]
MRSPGRSSSNAPVDRTMVEARAASFTTRSLKKQAKLEGHRMAVAMTDLTTLEGKDTPGKIRSLCRKAMQPSGGTPLPPDAPHLPAVAAVCVYPELVEVARETLGSSGVRVASVATAFPSGQYPLSVRLDDVAMAVAAGADEIDMVISRGAFLSGKTKQVVEEIREIKSACGSAHLKIILETGELETLDNVRRASDLAIEAVVGMPGGESLADGEVFIKTSTGKVNPAATMPVVLVMLEAIRDAWFTNGIRIGMKPAGGIRTAKQALHYLVMVKETLDEAWLNPGLFRFGASSLLDDLVRQYAKQLNGRYMAGYDVARA